MRSRTGRERMLSWWSGWALLIAVCGCGSDLIKELLEPRSTEESQPRSADQAPSEGAGVGRLSGSAPEAVSAVEPLIDDAPVGERTALDSVLDECGPVVSRLKSSEKRYRSWVDWKAGPSLSDRYISYGLYEVTGAGDCVTALTSAAETLSQDPEFIAVCREMAPAIASLAAIVNQAQRYYDAERYQDDNLQLGRELHPQLMTGFNYFGPLAERFERWQRQRRASLDEALLARLRRVPGARYAFLVEQVRVRGDELADQVQQVAVHAGGFSGATRGELAAAAVQLREALDQFESARQQDDAVHASALEHDPESMLEEAREMQEAADVLVRLMQKPAPLSRSERGDAESILTGAGSVPFHHDFFRIHYRGLARELGHLD